MWRLGDDRHRHPQKLVAAGNEHSDAIAGLVVVEAPRELVGTHAPLVDGENLVVRRESIRGRRALLPGACDDEPAVVVAGRHAKRGPAAATRCLESKPERAEG